MMHSNQIVAAMLAHVRGEISAPYVADLCGVTEFQVQQWKDVFVVAGVLAVANALKPQAHDEPRNEEGGGGLGFPTTTPFPFP